MNDKQTYLAVKREYLELKRQKGGIPADVHNIFDIKFYTETKLFKTRDDYKGDIDLNLVLKAAVHLSAFYNDQDIIVMNQNNGTIFRVPMQETINDYKNNYLNEVTRDQRAAFIIDSSNPIFQHTLIAKLKPYITELPQQFQSDIFEALTNIQTLELSDGNYLFRDAYLRNKTRLTLDRNKPILKQYLDHVWKYKLWDKPFNVTFNGEFGIDAGGLTKEMYRLIGNELLDGNYFICTGSNEELKEKDKVRCKKFYTINPAADFKVFIDARPKDIGLKSFPSFGISEEEIKKLHWETIEDGKLVTKIYNVDIGYAIADIACIFFLSVLSEAKLSIPLSHIILGIIKYGDIAIRNPLNDIKDLTEEKIISMKNDIFTKPNNIFYYVNLDDCGFQKYFTKEGIAERLTVFNSIYTDEDREKVIGTQADATAANYANVLLALLNDSYGHSIYIYQNSPVNIFQPIYAFSINIIGPDRKISAKIFQESKSLEDVQKYFSSPPTIEQWISHSKLEIISNSRVDNVYEFKTMEEFHQALFDPNPELTQYANFWDILRDDPNLMEPVYRFVTSSESFIAKNHTFTFITDGNNKALPYSKTCFNMVIMPIYFRQ